MNDALRVALSDTGHTTESLAETVGVDPKTVGRWLAEDRIPHPRHRLAAAEASSAQLPLVALEVARGAQGASKKMDNKVLGKFKKHVVSKKKGGDKERVIVLSVSRAHWLSSCACTPPPSLTSFALLGPN